jgi:hypothetical protein
VTLLQELFILSSGHHLRRTPHLPAIKLTLLRSLTARRTILPPSAPSKSLFLVAFTLRKATGRPELFALISIRRKYRASEASETFGDHP